MVPRFSLVGSKTFVRGCLFILRWKEYEGPGCENGKVNKKLYTSWKPVWETFITQTMNLRGLRVYMEQNFSTLNQQKLRFPYMVFWPYGNSWFLLSCREKIAWSMSDYLWKKHVINFTPKIRYTNRYIDRLFSRLAYFGENRPLVRFWNGGCPGQIGHPQFKWAALELRYPF